MRREKKTKKNRSNVEDGAEAGGFKCAVWSAELLDDSYAKKGTRKVLGEVL